ncbi:MAG TPA: helix-turn-helix domain-containing protein [Acidimicrobiia bacterium]|nr:helix-turn-helix domain-containing protein [Acidimicrobiia bacterium]
MRRDDAWVRAHKATEEMERHLAAIARLADERAIAIQELLDHGLTRSEVARRLGVTPAVITKILKRPVLGGARPVERHRGDSDVHELSKADLKPRSDARA